MKKNLINNIYSSYYFILILYVSLIVGFVLNENSTGGAYIDYLGQKKISSIAFEPIEENQNNF